MWTPLMPLTQPRTVTESFGNIIRGIEVDGTTIPASTELEDIVNALHKQNTQSGVLSGPVGVWAMVIPNPETSGALDDWLEEAPEPISVLPDVDDIRDTVKATGQHLKKLYSHGGRLYKISLPDITEPFVPGVAFGVSGDAAVPRDPEPIGGFIGQHFGALSNSAIYLSGQGLPGGKETKLSVPHSRVYGREPETKPGVLRSLFGIEDVGSLVLDGLKHH
ncbi:hypothetical protein TrVFT333_004883 [Trichoderma virens FT-333]|nr:hypothetical protein TrVFT333_004883 [Trichoderma virens FT-333]